jgi:hypothetical protein
MHPSHLITSALVGVLALSSIACSNSGTTEQGPVITTPAGAKVDLSGVSMKISKANISVVGENSYQLSFDYTLQNKADAAISFLSIFSNTDDLIEISLSDQNSDPLFLGKRPMEGLTLAAPRAILISKGKSTRSYKVPVMPESRVKGDPITVRVRLHAPSRYDELRTSVEAPLVQVSWPQGSEIEPIPSDPEEYPLTSPTRDATPLPTR